MTLFQEMQQKRRAWTRTIEKAKASHWKQFLDEAGEGKLWKAATYMKPREAWGCIPALHVGTNELTENEDKAQAFLDAFFPEMDKPHERPPTQAPLELPWQPITELEIQRSLKAAKGSTAPGDDDLPMLVWKQLWIHLKSIITRHFHRIYESRIPPEAMAEREDRGAAETRETRLLESPGPTARSHSLTR